MFQKASFTVKSIHSRVPMGERGSIMKDWNRTDTKFDILVLNSSVSSAGLNAHYNCHYGIGACFVWNMATILQFIGRLERLGQRHAVTWYLPYFKGTIDEWLMERRLRKVRPHPTLNRLVYSTIVYQSV